MAPAAESAAAAPAAAAPAAAAVPAAAEHTAAAPVAKAAPAAKAVKAAKAAPVGKVATTTTAAKVQPNVSDAQKAADQKIYDAKNGATDVGITRDQIRLGSVNMHGMALGNVLTRPQAISNMATAAAINDRGGVLGRKLTITDCDDGPGEVSRAKACIKKLVGQDHIFSLITGIDWATASIHDDLKQNHLPYVGAWAYSQTEWQDPFMFPTHMSMIHEAMSGAHWAANVIKPKTYGLICLTSPEMQIACNAVEKIMDATGAKMVKRADVSISETSMSAYVLAMRAANPEHIIHYVINPSTMAKFMVESAQQGYYPPKGISGNHLATEILGSIFGNWPAGRYWTNTTYKLWGPELMAIVAKYGRGARGQVHHIIQAGYMAINVFALASR
ncbi:MAG TPA: ABC transporter substrate-binding protein, partial [Sporichthyaceae bacterium]|nr:ABC transporter substrate-binding protein [Sporichthyaceae bacterium]